MSPPAVCGASVNALSRQFAVRAGLEVHERERSLIIRLGGGKQTVVPRRVTTFSIKLPNFPMYTTGSFVTEISESNDAMLGMPWLNEVNPIIDWMARRDSGVYLLVEFRDVFRSELPSVPPARQGAMDASIDVSDANPDYLKQFPLSKDQREAIVQWTREMLKAKLIRPSSSPYCAPTLCFRKPSGE
ncbi:hypothetical protein PHMEG_00025732 [Phytophthora megakarya]|uniref:Uncharacterized protein n=1 Tax=Phytophthora megakarya TaxID=4795 RepID=A0A225VC55_9STRA|nr:hypothetical protein PHMEG_00025732 [Phytophthora megakarya]